MTEAIINSIAINTNKKNPPTYYAQSNKFIKALADYFREKNLIKVPTWGVYVKCSQSNELSPTDANWFYIKAAAIARRVYITKNKTLGVGTLKRILGKKDRRGSQPNIFSKAAGKIIRNILQQLKKLNYVESYCTAENTTMGLTMTKLGKSQLEMIGNKVNGVQKK
jgi:small subunit ribosomal protein S19e